MKIEISLNLQDKEDQDYLKIDPSINLFPAYQKSE
jgi:hypothetical protein